MRISCSSAASCLLLFFLLASAHLALISADSSTTQCSDAVTSLTPCATYVQPKNQQQPSSQCCDGLKTVADSAGGLQCLCQLQGLTLGSINETRAYQLPSLCNLTISGTITCAASATSPAPSISAPPKKSNGSSDGHRAVLPSVLLPVTFAGFVYSIFFV